MKRLLGVMAIIALVSSVAFGVTGEIFTKIKEGGVSEGDTGFKLNYDAFGVEYKFVEKFAFEGVNLYSPGYVNVTGIKAGPLTLGAGVILAFGYDNPFVTITTNPAATNNNGDAEVRAYSIDVKPRIALNIGSINITTSDQSRIIFREQATTSYAVDYSATNKTGARLWEVKVGANMKGAWNGELGGFYHIAVKEVQSTGSWTKEYVQDPDDLDLHNGINSWGDFTLPLNSDMDFYVKGWFKWDNTRADTKTITAPGITNISATYGSSAYFGPEVRVQYKIAGGQVKLNLGAGLAWKLWENSYNEITMLNNVETNIVTTNTQSSWITLYGVKRDDNRALMQFGGSTKFGDWEFGIDSRLDFSVSLYQETFEPSTGTKTTVVLNDTAPWSEPLFIPIVKTIYLKYSKSMFTVTFNIIKPDQERGSYEDTGVGFGTDATKRWFYSVDFSYKF